MTESSNNLIGDFLILVRDLLTDICNRNETVPNFDIKSIMEYSNYMIAENRNELEKYKETVEKLNSAEEKLKNKSMEFREVVAEMRAVFEKLEGENENLKNEMLIRKLREEDELAQKSTSTLIPPVSHKNFTLKHSFKNFSTLKINEKVYSDEDEHFGLPWKLAIIRNENLTEIFLECLKSQEKWSIETQFDINITYGEQKKSFKGCEKIFGKEETEESGHFFEIGESMNEDLLIEVYVKIEKMYGVYKENLRNFDESNEDVSDVRLVVGGDKFYVSKLYLATHSSYFKSLFLMGFKESNQSEITLTGINSCDFQKYLEVLYGEDAIDESNVEGILLIADMYDTPIVAKKCSTFLMEKSGKSLKKKLQMSSRYNLEQLKRKSISEISTIAEIRSIFPGKIHDLDNSILSELLEKSLVFR